jgi:hypothetical protein
MQRARGRGRQHSEQEHESTRAGGVDVVHRAGALKQGAQKEQKQIVSEK